jgi:hypothetical protein
MKPFIHNTFSTAVATTVRASAQFLRSGHDTGGVRRGVHRRLDQADRFELRDGLMHRRQAYFDPTPIVVGVFLRPWLLPHVLRGLLG